MEQAIKIEQNNKIMGAWGINTFENDDAADWFAEYCDEPNEELLFDAFSTVNGIGDDYLEAPESSVALAAAEVVAALKESRVHIFLKRLSIALDN